MSARGTVQHPDSFYRKTQRRQVYISDAVWEALRRHAHDRNVPISRLIHDLLTLWVAGLTDWQHPSFADPPCEKVELPKLRTDYVITLGFQDLYS